MNRNCHFLPEDGTRDQTILCVILRFLIMNRKIRLLFLTISFGIFFSCSPSVYKNHGESRSEGTVGNGRLINGYKMPFRGGNFKYFSFTDYYLFGRCYLHSTLQKIVLESYRDMSMYYPDYRFRIMECSKRKGGRAIPHRTHQNGTSIDFMMPLKKADKVISRYDRIGMWRYLMKFDHEGKKRFNKQIEIDFDKMALHILTLEKVSRKYGWMIAKVILETNLKDEIFASRYGKELRKSGIYFVRNLPKLINEAHDDHYHVDFVPV
ncbi:MAG: hypothetical protein JW801_09015 [Bacteroidales bacterium]|nr:hypothetical protein [Bacteroidales bacterium]